MSATDIQHQKPEENKPRLAYYQINPSYTLRVVCCVIFIFLTEILLAHYIYRLINTEVKEEYLLKRDFEENFLNVLRTSASRDEIVRILKEIDLVGNRNYTRGKREAYVANNDNVLNAAAGDDGPSLDFYSLRKARQSKGDPAASGSNKKGATNAGEVWLTSHNRISTTLLDKIHENHPGQIGHPKVLTTEDESIIAKTLGNVCVWGYPMTSADIVVIISGFVTKHSRNVREWKDNRLGYEFINQFAIRNSLSQRLAADIKQQRACIGEAQIREFFGNAEPHLLNARPCNVYNYDETNITDDPGSKKVLVPKGRKRVERIQEHSRTSISIMVCGTAEGKLLAPMVVYKSMHLYENWTQEDPNETVYANNAVEYCEPAISRVRDDTGICPDGRICLRSPGGGAVSVPFPTINTRVVVTCSVTTKAAAVCKLVELSDMQTFCLAAKDYCPSPKPGNKGDRGETGYPGLPGPIGPRGDRGFPGEKGDQGRTGLDGRDGVPGEPGFDGMPGRNGHDGLPGIDGKPGIPGTHGRNGSDGRPGLPGPQGPPGPQGSKGLTGPRGRPGRPGNHGTPGIPGINSWKYGNASEYMIPPSIARGDFPSGRPIGPIIVEENDNVTLNCAASGVPRPHVEWRRLDNRPITRGPWQDASVTGHTLNITFVSRNHMGLYQCIADNGIPPQVNQTFLLEVHFKPLIKINNQLIGANNGSIATLECEVEAFPEPIRYWERADGRLLENGDKYKINNAYQQDGFKIVMQLVITRITTHDFTKYYCVAKNDRDFSPTKGSFEVYELRPGAKPKLPQKFEVGPTPPARISYESLCPPPHCPICVDPKECKETGVSLIDLIGKWEIKPYQGFENHTEPTNRATDCVLYAIGKPVYHRFTNQTYGSWMKDAAASERDGDKYWSTNENDAYELRQFDSKTDFRKDDPSKTYTMAPYPFRGNAHVVYNGSFYYAERDKPEVMKMNLANESRISVPVPLLTANDSNYLYSNRHNYMDFNVDDNGLWVIFGVPNSNNTAVMKMDPTNLQIEYIWNISLNHQKVGDMFVVCGVLYAVDSVSDRNSRIRFALDLYKKTLLDVNLAFTNPFKNTTMVGYNHKNKELYTWDKGNQLTYPVRYHEIGYRYATKEEKLELLDSAEAHAQTGFTINPH